LADLDSDALDRLAELLAPRLERIATAPASSAGQLLTCGETATRAGTCVDTIRRAIRSGALGAYRVGREWRIAPADLEAWLIRGKARTQPSSPPRAQRPGAALRPLADALAALDRRDRGGIR
jgi:excisionase family DNA binding protein